MTVFVVSLITALATGLGVVAGFMIGATPVSAGKCSTRPGRGRDALATGLTVGLQFLVLA